MNVSAIPSAVKGWCPGALRPMMAGDGLLVRLRPRCGIVPQAAALAIADCAERFGNGLIELTSRANLQLRGVRPETLQPLQAALAQLGLLDADAAGEAVRNIIASPLAGLDARARLDIRPVVAALGARLAGDARLHALPGKFGFVVEDGGSFDLSGTRADVRFMAVEGGFAVFRAGSGNAFRVCAAAEVPDVAAEAAMAMMAAGSELLPQKPYSPLVRAEGLFAQHSCLGHHPAFTGLTRAFGRWTAAQWRKIAELAGELRLTPWRILLIPYATPHLAAVLASQGNILDPADPRLAVAACPGAPACAAGTTSTQADALQLATIARQLGTRNITLHVSGCTKGCACHEKTPATLVARDGLYDLVLDGGPGDPPSLTGLDLRCATRALAALARGGSLHGNFT